MQLLAQQLTNKSPNQHLPPWFPTSPWIDRSLYRINLISDHLNPSLKTTIYSLNILLILFRNDSLLTDTSFGKIKVREFNTPLPQRIRLKPVSPAYTSTPAGLKSPGLLKGKHAGMGVHDAGVPHHPTVELESAHTVRFPYKADAPPLSPIVLSFLFQGQQPLHEENMQA